VQIVAFNLREGWCRDVSCVIAREVLIRCDVTDLSPGTAAFVEQHAGEDDGPWSDPVEQALAALAMIRLAVAASIPDGTLPPREGLSIGEEAEALARAIRHLRPLPGRRNTPYQEGLARP
jgi:hypothetical protein